MPRPAKEQDTGTLAGQIGAIIRSKRLRARLSVEEAATKAGCPAPTWYNWEAGRHLRLDRLPQIAQALGCKLRTLLPDV